jgi:hypothetical protein
MNCLVADCCLVVVEEVVVCCRIAHVEVGNDFGSSLGAGGLLQAVQLVVRLVASAKTS